MNQIHGHEVMSMMLDSGKIYTKEELVAEVISKFGPEARFYTCSAQDLSAEKLIAFLELKGKLVTRPGGFQTSAELMCSH
jgi:probable metal-binding protein